MTALGYSFVIVLRDQHLTELRRTPTITLTNTEYQIFWGIMSNTYPTQKLVAASIIESNGPFTPLPTAVTMIKDLVAGTPLPVPVAPPTANPLPPVITPIPLPPAPPPPPPNHSFTLACDDGTQLQNKVLPPDQVTTLSQAVTQYRAVVTDLGETSNPVTDSYSYYLLFAQNHLKPVITAPPPAPPGSGPPPLPPPPKTGNPIIDEIIGIGTAIEDDFAQVIKQGEDMVQAAWKNVLNLVPTAGEVKIEDSPVNALGVAIPAISAGFAIYGLTTATDLLHPIKGTGLVPMGIDVVNKLGTGLITTTIIGAAITAYLGTPLRYYWNSIIRPHRPVERMTDIMYFKAQIDKATWSKYYSYQGYPDQEQAYWFGSMFTEPSLRFIVRLVDDPNIPLEWFGRKFRNLGFNDEDQAILKDFVSRTQGKADKLVSITNIVKRHVQGFTTDADFVSELGKAGATKAEIDNHIQEVVFAKDENFKKEAVKIWTQSYIKDAATRDDMVTGLTGLIVDPLVLQQTIDLADLAKLAKPKSGGAAPAAA